MVMDLGVLIWVEILFFLNGVYSWGGTHNAWKTNFQMK